MKVEAPILARVWRGDFQECVHRGHIAVVNVAGNLIASWGDPNIEILPRSSCKMLQALPLIESGAADAAGLTSEQFALSCASHNGAAVHFQKVSKWLRSLDRTDDDLRCGPQAPNDEAERETLIRAYSEPSQCHNNCSGKHVGFLTLNQHLGGDAEYHDPSHRVQIAVREAFESMVGETSRGYAIDGCSAPNFACSLTGLARGMAKMASPGGGVRGDACRLLVDAMMKHPVLVAGEGRACTELITAAQGVVVKTGAEGVFTAILPEKKLGVALKVEDGATRASEAAMTALLVKYGVLDAQHPAAQARLNAPVVNRNGMNTGRVTASL